MAAIQTIDATTLKALLAELRPVLLPSRFEKAQQSDPRTIQIALRSLEGCHWLELGWQAEAPRLHAIEAPPKLGEGSTLAQQLQHGLRGLALVELRQQGWERVAELRFARRPGEPVQRSLVLELMGRHSNLFLLDDRERVIAAARQVRSSQSRRRPIATGDPYSPPPPLTGEPPRLGDSDDDWIRRLCLLPLSLEQALLQSYQGISPALVRQLLEGLPEAERLSQPVHSLRPDQWPPLRRRWLAWLEAVEAERFVFRAGGVSEFRCWDPEGRGAQDPPEAGSVGQGQTFPLPLSAEPRAAADPLPISRGLADYYGQRLGALRLGQRRRALQQRLEAGLARERREAERQQELLAAVPGADALSRQADALLCAPEPDRAEIEAAQKLYHQARRLRRSVAAITPRLELHRSRAAWLEASLHFLERSEDLAALEELEQDLEALLSPRQGERRRRREVGRPQPLEVRSPGGLRLLVGRNHRQNDWISLRQARPGDLWFHAQECPGSHVVLKASEAAAEEGDLAAAADLAAHFSRARGNRRVPVVMVAAETLQRIPGEPPGTVRHGAAEVLWGEPERALALLETPSAGPTLDSAVPMGGAIR